jgi:hypothetical protein
MQFFTGGLNMDFLYLALLALWFAATVGMVVGCARLMP